MLSLEVSKLGVFDFWLCDGLKLSRIGGFFDPWLENWGRDFSHIFDR